MSPKSPPDDPLMQEEARRAVPGIRREVRSRLRRRRITSTSAMLAVIGLAIALPLVLTDGGNTPPSHGTSPAGRPHHRRTPPTTVVPPPTRGTTPPSPTTTQSTVSSNSSGSSGPQLSATSEPRSGALGSTSIQATATLTGIGPNQTGSLEFDVSQGPYNEGQPASVESAAVRGPGTYRMPDPYRPDHAGSWYVTVDFGFTNGPGSGLTASGMPSPNNPHPESDLVTTIATVPGAPPCDPNMPGGNNPGIRPSLIFIGCATSADHLSNIVWTGWTATSAVGTGTHAINNCQPNCAQGSFTTDPVKIQLTNPGYVNAVLVFRTISLTPTSGRGTPETTSQSWGWVPNT